MRFPFRVLNIRGELFASTATYAASALVKLVSSLILTRLLDPSSYGVIGIIFSVAFVIELLSDVGATALLIRHGRGNEVRFIRTLWTIRFIRNVLSFLALYFLAPLIAQAYDLPVLRDALRLFSPWFLFAGMESMAYIIGQRNQRAKIGNYVDLASSLVAAIFVIVAAVEIKDYSVFIFGALLQRAINALVSHFFYREIGVGFAFDWDAVGAQFSFAKVVLPSSILTILLSQYDKVVLLKLFDLERLGIYGLAGSMIGPVGGLVMHNCRVILYPRCATYFRENPLTAKHRYYSESAKLARVVAYPPMVLAGFAFSVVALLYDLRYQSAGQILLILSLGTFIGSLQGMSENFLVASGRTSVVLHCNIVRTLLMVPFTFAGYYFFGFVGFVWGAILVQIPALAYCYHVQRVAGLLDICAESKRLLSGIAIFVICFGVSALIHDYIPPDSIRHFFKAS